MTLKRDILKSPTRTCTLNSTISPQIQSPKSFEPVLAQDQIGELVVHVHHHGVVLSLFPRKPTLFGKVTFAMILREYAMPRTLPVFVFVLP